MKAVEAEDTEMAKLLLDRQARSNIRNEVEPVRRALKLECCLFYCPSAVETYVV